MHWHATYLSASPLLRLSLYRIRCPETGSSQEIMMELDVDDTFRKFVTIPGSAKKFSYGVDLHK